MYKNLLLENCNLTLGCGKHLYTVQYYFTPCLLSWLFETLGKAGDPGDLCHGVSVELVVDLQHQGVRDEVPQLCSDLARHQPQS